MRRIAKFLWIILTLVMAFPVCGILGGGLAGILGAFGKPSNGGNSSKANVFKKVLSHTDWWDTLLETSSDAIAVIAGVWAVIGRFKVPAQQLYHFGFGDANHPDNQGYVYMDIYDDTATNSVREPGAVRLVQRNNQGTIQLTVAEYRTEQLYGDTADRNKQIALPEQTQFPWVAEDSYLEIQFKPDASDTIVQTAIGTAAAKDIWNVPVTVKQ